MERPPFLGSTVCPVVQCDAHEESRSCRTIRGAAFEIQMASLQPEAAGQGDADSWTGQGQK
jgi:hypothetical protein